MIDRDETIVFVCDECGEVLETDEADWTPAKDVFDEKGWKAKRVGKEGWSHYCPDCGKVR